jgi:hypothetical protein
MSASSTSIALTFARRLWPVAEHHARGVLHALHGEFESCKTLQRGQLPIQFRQGSQGVIALANQAKLNSRRVHLGLDIGDSEDHDLVTALLEPPRQRNHWVEVSGSRKTKRTNPRHASLPLQLDEMRLA